MKQLKDIIKIAAFDVDGTILPNGSLKFSNNTRKMFGLLKNNDIITVISTAREFATIGDFLDQLDPVDYFIGANGSFVWDNQNKKFLFKNTLNKDEVVKLYDSFSSEIKGFLITDFNKVYKSPQTPLNSWFIKPFEENYKNYDEALLSNTDLYIITINTTNVRDLSDKMETYIKENNFKMEISARWSGGFFITPMNVNKSSTLKNLCSHLNLSMDNLIAFGDSSNDFEMIRDAYYGIAMQRANEKIKSVAKEVAMDCEYDGAFFKLKELKLI